METPTSIWLEYKDAKSLASFRLSLLGETETKAKTDKPSKFDKIEEKNKALEDKVLKAEDPEAITNPETSEEMTADAKPRKSPGRYLNSISTIQVWLPLTFPPVPKKGDWDVARLRESKYFFS
jgi:DNA-directed RNA polymerase